MAAHLACVLLLAQLTSTSRLPSCVSLFLSLSLSLSCSIPPRAPFTSLSSHTQLGRVFPEPGGSYPESVWVGYTIPQRV